MLTKEQIAAQLDATREERVGYERRLAAATEKDDAEAAKKMQARLDAVDERVAWLEAGAPAERARGEDAETRPRGRGRQTR